MALSEPELAALLEGLPIPIPAATDRQPIHTVYGGAQLFAPGLARKLGDRALAALTQFGPPEGISEAVANRIAAKLRHEPIEDFRIDFEEASAHAPTPKRTTSPSPPLRPSTPRASQPYSACACAA